MGIRIYIPTLDCKSWLRISQFAPDLLGHGNLYWSVGTVVPCVGLVAGCPTHLANVSSKDRANEFALAVTKNVAGKCTPMLQGQMHQSGRDSTHINYLLYLFTGSPLLLQNLHSRREAETPKFLWAK